MFKNASILILFQFNKFHLYQWSKILKLINLFQIFLQNEVHLCYMIMQIEKLRCKEKMETLILQCLFSEYHWQRIEHVQFKYLILLYNFPFLLVVHWKQQQGRWSKKLRRPVWPSKISLFYNYILELLVCIYFSNKNF